ncbi:MAG: 1-deoxy-D-xylulose-5-phosphate synthase [Gemmatimonadota bacterium]
MGVLDRVVLPQDLRKLSQEELHQVVDEVRDRHIDVVSKIGGHFAPSLGVTELTVALHYVFDTPGDLLVWDVGHQAYIHKILTGRNDRFPTIRQRHGLAPFLRRDESEFDTFGAGHAATSISAAFGMATARDLMGDDYSVAAIIGDGAMTSGMAFEALNNAGDTERDFIVVLNDNEMSIAPNVGAMNKYLTGIITNPTYNRVKGEVKELLHKAPRNLGGMMEAMAGKLEESVKHMLVPGMLFEELGFRYVGPVDGHDLDALVDTFRKVKGMKGPILVHALTQKGKGYSLAEENPWKWHASSPWDKITGLAPKKAAGSPRYQAVFGKGLAELGAEFPQIVTITAAMPDGTSTGVFGDTFPDRFFDVGIAEGHGVTFAAGMATRGIRPVVAIYSTFLQRAFDSVVHDVALQSLPVIFCMDRAGIAGEDGPTHHGIFDIAYMLAVPGMTVTAPKDGTEMLGLLRTAMEHETGPFALRYPRDTVPDVVPSISEIQAVEYGSWEILRRGSGPVAILATGTMVGEASEAAQVLIREHGVDATVVNCRFMKPYDKAVLTEVLQRHEKVLVVEEGTVVNGFGAFMSREIAGHSSGQGTQVRTMGVPDEFIDHGSRPGLLDEMGLNSQGIVQQIRELAGALQGPSASRETA